MNTTLWIPVITISTNSSDPETLIVMNYTQPPSGNLTVLRGNASFTFNVSDGNNGSAPGVVTIVVSECPRSWVVVLVEEQGRLSQLAGGGAPSSPFACCLHLFLFEEHAV